MEDQAVHVAGQTGQRDFGFRPLEADEEPHPVLRLSENMLDPHTDRRPGGVDLRGALRPSACFRASCDGYC